MSLVYRWPRLYAAYDLLRELLTNTLFFWGLMKRNEPDENIRLDGQTVIVTGGNRGFGAGITRDMVLRGARVIIACRDISKANELLEDIQRRNRAASVALKRLDLSSFDSVRKFAGEIIREESRIDVLINNSGTITKDQVSITEDGCERVLQVNYLSHVLLTYLLLDKMKSTSNDGRIVFVSSVAHHRPMEVDLKKVPTKYFDCYSLSKIAINMFVNKLASKWPLEFPLRVYSVDPGISGTDIVRNMNTERKDTWLFNSFLFQQLMRSPKEGSNSIIFPVISDKSTYNKEEWYSQDGKFKKPAKLMLKQELVDKVWKQTFEIIDVPEIV